jgi:hypothetical protein
VVGFELMALGLPGDSLGGVGFSHTLYLKQIS